MEVATGHKTMRRKIRCSKRKLGALVCGDGTCDLGTQLGNVTANWQYGMNFARQTGSKESSVQSPESVPHRKQQCAQLRRSEKTTSEFKMLIILLLQKF
jgi:hypothetical protein